jgi:hypothetical protein
MGWHRACPPSTLQISFHFSVKVGAMRFRTKARRGLVDADDRGRNDGMAGWIGWTTAWLIERVIS